MQVDGYLPLSADAQCAWEAGGREATTLGTGPNGPVCLFIGMLQLSEGRAATIARNQTNLTAEQLRAVLRNWQTEADDQGEVLLNLAIVRDRAQSLARAARRPEITAEDLLAVLADPANEGTRLHRVLMRAGPALDLPALRQAALAKTEPTESGTG